MLILAALVLATVWPVMGGVVVPLFWEWWNARKPPASAGVLLVPPEVVKREKLMDEYMREGVKTMKRMNKEGEDWRPPEATE